MKRKELVGYLTKNGCMFLREGANHSVFFNPLINKTSTIPRHSEINNFLAKKICKDLGITPIIRK